MVHDSEKIFQLSNYSNIKNILETEKTNYPYFYIYIKRVNGLEDEEK